MDKRIIKMLRTGNVPPDHEFKSIFLSLCQDYADLKRRFEELEKDYLNHLAKEDNWDDNIKMKP